VDQVHVNAFCTFFIAAHPIRFEDEFKVPAVPFLSSSIGWSCLTASSAVLSSLPEELLAVILAFHGMDSPPDPFFTEDTGRVAVLFKYLAWNGAHLVFFPEKFFELLCERKNMRGNGIRIWIIPQHLHFFISEHFFTHGTHPIQIIECHT